MQPQPQQAFSKYHDTQLCPMEVQCMQLLVLCDFGRKSEPRFVRKIASSIGNIFGVVICKRSLLVI